ncbi:MAG: hypothetical protein IT307_00620 [Chloroflexi bacterium]|nr:hypothetical protein [Chloroflexota bacterium]
MHSSLIGKIQKANLYAREPERVRFSEFSATFKGEHDAYDVSLSDGQWRCSCHFFPTWHTCSHVMALQKLIGSMLPKEATYFPSGEAAAAGAS